VEGRKEAGPDGGGEAAERLREDLDYGCLNDLVGHLLRHAFLRGQQVFADVFAGEALTPLQFMVLELVDRNDDITHGDVAAAMSCAPSVLTTALKPLTASGTLEQVTVAGDRRRVAYRLSATGRERFLKLRPMIGEAEDRLLDGLEADDREALARILRRVSRRNSQLRNNR
jgi:DNA-binding MarR family transcriptional regulator